MTTAKNEVFIGLQQENSYLVRGWTFCGGGGVRWDRMSNQWRDSSIPPVQKTLLQAGFCCVPYMHLSDLLKCRLNSLRKSRDFWIF